MCCRLVGSVSSGLVSARRRACSMAVTGVWSAGVPMCWAQGRLVGQGVDEGLGGFPLGGGGGDQQQFGVGADGVFGEAVQLCRR